jgi:uncharacterized protein YndB with AHSA1/START domain
MKRDLKFEWFYPHSIGNVWHCLTNADLIAKWLMTNDFKPQVGHRFKFTAQPMPGWCGIVDCEVLEVVENSRLSYTWVSGPKPGSKDISTVVTWQLTSVQGGTRLVLEHTGFAGFRGYMTSFILGKGWKSKIANAFENQLDKLGAQYGQKV